MISLKSEKRIRIWKLEIAFTKGQWRGVVHPLNYLEQGGDLQWPRFLRI